MAGRGFSILVYDPAPLDYTHQKISPVNNIQELILYAEIILGCTYADTTVNLSLEELNSLVIHKKIFLNAASNDAPFHSLIKKLAQRWPERYLSGDIFQEQQYPMDYGVLCIRPFPINFDTSAVSVPHKKIGLTRSLLALAIGQSSLLLEDTNYPNFCKKAFIQLSPEGQKRVIEHWIEENPEEQLSQERNILEATLPKLKEVSSGIPYYHASLQFLEERDLLSFRHLNTTF